MLRQRVITALLMVAVLLPAVFATDVRWLAVVGLLLIVAAGWEWGRLIGWSSSAAACSGLSCLLACGLTWWLDPMGLNQRLFWSILAGLWCLGGAWMLSSGLQRWPQLPMGLKWVLGLGVLWSTWVALFNAKTMGTNFTLSVLVLVWAADISAYFAGRAFGRHKLAPAISPGKSWEGVAGAALGVLLLSQIWLQIDVHRPDWSPSLYTRLFAMDAWVALACLGALTAMSVVGDLVESLLKRCAGVKDSSQLLPGHGGVLDRIDALLPTLPFALCLSSWVTT
jgi:phosphatidate cytidylyltransferase